MAKSITIFEVSPKKENVEFFSHAHEVRTAG